MSFVEVLQGEWDDSWRGETQQPRIMDGIRFVGDAERYNVDLKINVPQDVQAHPCRVWYSILVLTNKLVGATPQNGLIR
jgi:hypothetical protein